jgi:hypothetical protein
LQNLVNRVIKLLYKHTVNRRGGKNES